MDSTAQQIIRCLRENPRATNREVAEEIGLAEPTVATRIRQMADKSQMRVIAQKHLFSDGYTSMHIYFVSTSSNSLDQICEAIGEHDGVFCVSQGIGDPEIVVLARTSDLNDAFDLTKHIAAVDGVAKVDAVTCYKIHKYRTGYGEITAGSETSFDDVDDLDDQIFSKLRWDGRQSNREIGRQLGESEGRIRHRINNLLTKGQMRFETLCDTSFSDMNVIAIGRLQTLPNHADKIIRSLSALSENVGLIVETTGNFNIHLVLTSSSNVELSRLCNDQIRSMEGVIKLDVETQVKRTKYEIHLSYFEQPTLIPKRRNTKNA